MRSHNPSLTSVPDSWPWLSACVGWLVAGALTTFAAWAWGIEPSTSLRIGPMGAFSGGLLGPLLVIWLRGVVDRRRASSRGPDLWDPWLDEGGTDRRGPGLELGEIVPARALVRPRVLSAEGGSFCLEDEVYPFAKGGQRGLIRIDGPTGSGKSTALRHLLATLPEELGVRVLDEPDEATLADHAGPGLVVYAADAPLARKHLAMFLLAPWGEDERIEYLLSVASERCGSVMARLKAADDGPLAEGNPELWRVVLDRMIADDSVAGVREGLRRELAARLRDLALRERAGDHCLRKMNVPVPLKPEVPEWDEIFQVYSTLHRLVRHHSVKLLIAADRIADDLAKADGSCSFLTRRLPRDLVVEAGLLIHDRPEAIDRLISLFDRSFSPSHPMAASLLHASKIGWRPATGLIPYLSYAYLDGVDWPGIALPSAQMSQVEMADACLWKATLDRARLDNAKLSRARLSGSSLEGISAIEVDLSHADLSVARADGAVFRRANLAGARLGSASLRGCEFQQANLAGARFAKADLTHANFHEATIDGADFSGANLESAVLGRLTLSKANFAGASFAGAELTECNLEGMELPGANFGGAKLFDALLTHSIMPKANFRNANLRGAGLAEVSWEGACLAGTDLRGASFHMGSSRSGLVNSPIASEGSRTGFYTDDFDEQDFKSPEEIRKADLRGGDLTGASIEGVDLYLVDLRGAILDPSQRLHARRCGAILCDRRG